MANPIFCKKTNSYLVQYADISLHSGPNNGEWTAVQSQELRRLYNIEKRSDELELQHLRLREQLHLVMSESEEQLGELQLLRRRDEYHSSLGARVQHLELQYHQLLFQYGFPRENEDSRIETGQLAASRMTQADTASARGRQDNGGVSLVTNRELQRLQNIERRQEALRAQQELDSVRQNRLLIQRIELLERTIQDYDKKIQQYESIIDMLNLGLREKDRKYNRLMTRHTTMMREE